MTSSWPGLTGSASSRTELNLSTFKVLSALGVINGSMVEADAALEIFEYLGTTETTVIDINVVAAVLFLVVMLDDLFLNHFRKEGIQ